MKKFHKEDNYNHHHKICNEEQVELEIYPSNMFKKINTEVKDTHYITKMPSS